MGTTWFKSYIWLGNWHSILTVSGCILLIYKTMVKFCHLRKGLHHMKKIYHRDQIIPSWLSSDFSNSLYFYRISFDENELGLEYGSMTYFSNWLNMYIFHNLSYNHWVYALLQKYFHVFLVSSQHCLHYTCHFNIWPVSWFKGSKWYHLHNQQ